MLGEEGRCGFVFQFCQPVLIIRYCCVNTWNVFLVFGGQLTQLSCVCDYGVTVVFDRLSCLVAGQRSAGPVV